MEVIPSKEWSVPAYHPGPETARGRYVHVLTSVFWVACWADALPDVTFRLVDVQLKNPIEQQMTGHVGLVPPTEH